MPRSLLAGAGLVGRRRERLRDGLVLALEAVVQHDAREDALRREEELPAVLYQVAAERRHRLVAEEGMMGKIVCVDFAFERSERRLDRIYWIQYSSQFTTSRILFLK